MIPTDLPADLPSFLARFGSDKQCREYLFTARWPQGFLCARCGHASAYAHKRRLIDECASCGKQHSLLAGTIFEQTKTGLARWFLAIFLVTSSKRGLSAAELKRQMGFGSDQTAWSWLHKIRRAMVRPEREPLAAPAQVDETYLGAPKPGKRGRGAAGKVLVAGAVKCGGVTVTDNRTGEPKAVRQLGRIRLAVVAAASAESLQGFVNATIACPGTITTDGAKAYRGLGQNGDQSGTGFQHDAVNLSQTAAEGLEPMSAIHLVFGHLQRWLLGTHHAGQSRKHLPSYLDEFAFRFNRRRAKLISHRFARLIEIAVKPPKTYWQIVGRKAPSLKLVEG